MTTRRIVVIGGLFASLLVTLLVTAAEGVRAEDTVVERPVSFQVVNRNTSGVACPFDNLPYTVQGHVVGPLSALEASGSRAITVYVHGFSMGEPNWAFKGVPGYDLPVELAKLGHISLTINRLGYLSSDHPPGFQSCLGTAADVVHQIIGQLRSPGVELPGGDRVTFSTVVLAGHDTGAEAVQIEAYSFRDIDGLMVAGFADTGFTQEVTEWSLEAGAVCAQGGEPSSRGAPNYHHFPAKSDEELRQDDALLHRVFYNTDEAVIEAVFDDARELNPCGDLASVPTGVASDLARLQEITAPVLYVLGDHDFGFSREGGERQAALYGVNGDVTSVIMENTGHFLMMGRTAPQFRAIINDWLCSRGFVTGGSCASTAGKVTGGGQIDGGDPVFSPTGDLLTLPAITPSAASGAQANFGMVVQYGSRDAAPRGNLNYRDHGTGDQIKATSFNGLIISGNHATITGVATVNGAAGKRFRVEIDDLAAGDAFTIEVLDGGYSNSGPVIGGNIKIHH